MAFVLPDFNLVCDIYDGNAGVPPSLPPRITGQECALVYGKRVNTLSTGGTGFAGVALQGMNLLLPKLVDIRGPQDTSGFPDIVVCPSGSGRFYLVFFVDDIGKGHSNEHRTAGMTAVSNSWSPPYP